MSRTILNICGAIILCTAGTVFAQAVKDATSDKPAVKTATLPANSDKALLVASPTPTPEPAEGSIDPRSKALEVAGAFTNDGFKIRDGYYKGVIEPNKPQLFAVNLYAGNQYWFCVGTTPSDRPPARKIAVSIYDENGKKIESEPYQDENIGAAGIVAGNSGRYFVEVTLEAGQKTDYCFLYAYK
ncbi:MAG: hypothetical protein ABI615_03130 [Chthoniobacterales bacterium]